MPKRLSEKTFYHYLKCPSWVYFDAHEVRREHEALLTRLVDDGLIAEMHRELLSDRGFVEVQMEDEDDAFSRTLELMKAGEQTILHGVLLHGHWVGHPDILERVEGKSIFGDYYYIACDIKRGRTIQDSYKFQGSFYAELLAEIQKTKPHQGYIMNAEGVVQSYLLLDFATEFHVTLEEIEKILAGKKPKHFLASGCKQSPWFSECRNESIGCDDLSLLNRIWKSEVQILNKVGIHTVHQMAVADPDLLTKKIDGIDRERLQTLRMRAVSLSEHRVIVLDSVPFPQSKTELYFDVESDPIRDLDFLFGVLVVEDKKETHHSFLAKSKEQEKEAWKEFLEFLKKYPGVPIYHFGWYEIEVLRRLGTKYDDLEQVEMVIEKQMQDLLMLIRDVIIFPLYSYSLKDIGKMLGFSWRHAEVSGIHAVLWYEEYLKNRRRTRKLQDIVDYNKDDCRATYIVKKWCAEKAQE